MQEVNIVSMPSEKQVIIDATDLKSDKVFVFGEEVDDFRTVDYEGLTTFEIQKLQPNWSLFLHGAPNGESPQQVASRADRFLQIVRAYQCNSVAFSSGHMIRMIAARWLKLPPEAGQYFLSSTASISVLGYEHDLNEPTILLWNETQES